MKVHLSGKEHALFAIGAKSSSFLVSPSLSLFVITLHLSNFYIVVPTSAGFSTKSPRESPSTP